MDGENELIEAVSGSIGSLCDFVFAELILLSLISVMGATAICLALWPRLLLVFVCEIIFIAVVLIVTRSILRNMTRRMDAISDGLREFGKDDTFRFDAHDGSIEDSMNMWMDEVTKSKDMRREMQAISDDAKRMELITGAMLTGIVPRDADMLLELQETSVHIQGVASSRIH